MTSAISFEAIPNGRIGSDPEAVARLMGIDIAPDRTVYVWSPDSMDTMKRHVQSSDDEVAGLLVGRVWSGDASASTLVSVDRALPILKHVERSRVHVTVSPQSWDTLSNEITQAGESALVVGWYHSHPGLSAFFSGTDRQTQAGSIHEPWQIGVVIDPVTGDRAVFTGPSSVAADADDVMRYRLALPSAGQVIEQTDVISSGAGARRARARRLKMAVAVTSLAAVSGVVAWRMRRTPRSRR